MNPTRFRRQTTEIEKTIASDDVSDVQDNMTTELLKNNIGLDLDFDFDFVFDFDKNKYNVGGKFNDNDDEDN